MVTIEEARDVTPELVDSFQRLVPQLSRSSPAPTAEELAELLDQGGTTVFVARLDDGEIVGTLTLVVFRIPTGLRARIEDVVVDDAARGHGVGKALTTAATEKAATVGCRTVDLTSGPSREAANAMYQRLGFEARDTNVYRYDLTK